MNERIRELADEADGVFIHKLMTGAKQYTFLEKDLEKFAELIVQECMACSTWVGNMNTNSVEPVHTAHAVNQRIKQQFGVEEQEKVAPKPKCSVCGTTENVKYMGGYQPYLCDSIDCIPF